MRPPVTYDNKTSKYTNLLISLKAKKKVAFGKSIPLQNIKNKCLQNHQPTNYVGPYSPLFCRKLIVDTTYIPVMQSFLARNCASPKTRQHLP